jgi:short-subunit dehydrogenase
MTRLDGTVAFITGASSGIGAALAEEFARRGADVALAARRADRLEEVAGKIKKMGRTALALGCDVTRDGDLEAAVGEVMKAFGRLDWAVANAGFGVGGAFHKLELEDFRRQFETNVFGVLRTAMATREALLETGGGLAIVGSVAGVMGLPRSSAYAMSKAAVRALGESLWFEFARYGASVTTILPGFVDSEMRQVDNRGVFDPDSSDPIPSWLSMRVDVAARKIVRAIVRRRRTVVITGHGKFAVTLFRFAPGTAARLIRRFGAGSWRERK